MPWRGPEYPGEFPTLGWIWADWIESRCVVPDRAAAGSRLQLTDWQLKHLLWQGRLHPDAEYDPDKPSAPFVYNGTLIVRPQKMGKGPFSATRVLLQGMGPALFAGYDEDGEPQAMAWPSPHVQIAATADDQTKNIWRVLRPMIELGPLSDLITDVGVDQINLANGGIIERVSSKALTRLGARITYVEIDQPESMTAVNHGEELVDTLLRNLGGTGGRWAATGNAHDPAMQSVQQGWIEKPVPEIFIDYPKPLEGSWANKRERRRILKHAYKGSPWVDIDRIESECNRLEAKGDPAQAERFYGNRVVAGSARAFNGDRIRELYRPGYFVARRARVVLSFDGAISRDSTGLVATEIATGHRVVVGFWPRPSHLREEDEWTVPIAELNEAVEWAFGFFDVWRLYADPAHHKDTVNGWAGKYGNKRVIEYWTHERKKMALELREYIGDMRPGVMSHGPLDETPQAKANYEAFLEHHDNAVRRPTNIRDDETGALLWLFGKAGDKSPYKVDLAMCGQIGWTGRGHAIASGLLKQGGAPVTFR